MASIDICHPHTLPHADAVAAVDRLASRIAERFEVDCNWNDDTLEFRRSGVDGEIHVQDDEIRVQVNLGFFLFALRGPIESEIERQLQREFG